MRKTTVSRPRLVASPPCSALAHSDVFTRAKRSQVMARIRGKDTEPEVRLRHALFALGLRYRLHVPGLPGCPDIVFPRYRAVVFVNGCFWHGHRCRLFKWPKNNAAFWREKIAGNISRDQRVRRQLSADGWRTFTVWECSIRRGRAHLVPAVASRIAERVRANSVFQG